MIILNILPQLILIVIGILILIYIIGIFVDKKRKPERDELNMTRLTSMILISRVIKEKRSLDFWICKNCKEENEDSFDSCWKCQTHSEIGSEKSKVQQQQKLCKEMLCDIFYVLNLFYNEKYNLTVRKLFVNIKGSFFIHSSERKEKLKKEFSELWEKVVDEKLSDEELKEYNLPEEKEVTLNLKEIDELINSFKDNKEWTPDLSSFWGIIMISYK